jgi:cytochrome c-type biogenesis protein
MDFGAGTYALGFLAGALSTLAPCVLPLLPIVAAAALAAHRFGPLALAAGLALAFAAAGIFISTVGYSIGYGDEWFRRTAAILLVLFGAVLMSARLRARFAASTAALSSAGGRLLARLKLPGWSGQFVTGMLLGVVWVPCVGPVLGAASIVAAKGEHLPQIAALMLAFGLGAATPLAVVGSLSRAALQKARSRLLAAGEFGRIALGALLFAVGVLILTGLEKRIEAFAVEHSPAWLIELTTRY